MQMGMCFNILLEEKSPNCCVLEVYYFIDYTELITGFFINVASIANYLENGVIAVYSC